MWHVPPRLAPNRGPSRVVSPAWAGLCCRLATLLRTSPPGPWTPRPLAPPLPFSLAGMSTCGATLGAYRFPFKNRNVGSSRFPVSHSSQWRVLVWLCWLQHDSFFSPATLVLPSPGGQLGH